jgi:hypothetical protein
MDYQLERKVVLVESDAHQLYPWSLQELNEIGEQVGCDQVPCESASLRFGATELQADYLIGLGDLPSLGDEEAAEPVQESEVIRGALKPLKVSYSLFGTSRALEQLDLRIIKARQGQDEGCELWGSPRYSVDMSPSPTVVTEEDVVGISMRLSPNRFDKLVELIRHRCVDSCEILLVGPTGFYAAWSPGSPTDIKILGDEQRQPVGVPESFKSPVPRIGGVTAFGVTVSTRWRSSERLEDVTIR